MKQKTKLRWRRYNFFPSSSEINFLTIGEKKAVVTARYGSGGDSGNAARRNISSEKEAFQDEMNVG